MTQTLGTTIAKRSPGAPDRPGRARLRIVFPGRLEGEAALDTGPMVLGRQGGAGALAIDEATVSRRHALIEWDAGRGLHVGVDLDSRNGSFIDGLPLGAQRRPLLDGSVFRIGDVLLIYEKDPAADPTGEIAAGAPVSQEALPGGAASMRALRARLARAAVDPAPVLVMGPSGTGKERIAGEIHRLSGRAGGLSAVNCAALSSQLIESQLFGHVKGAFTGASSAATGLFRAADGGTLFLDEIGELPLELQPKLLRAIQEGEVHPVGSTQTIRVDVRIVAATNRDLDQAVETGQFRRDLYARLALWELTVPALYQRRVDILPWLHRLHAGRTAQRGLALVPLELDADAAEAVLRFGWPANLRGLERLVHDLGTAGASGRPITRAELPAWLDTPSHPPGPTPAPPGASPAPAAPTPDPSVRPAAPTREQFLAAFAEHNGSVRALARHYGRDRKQIYRWMRSHGVTEQAPLADSEDDSDPDSDG